MINTEASNTGDKIIKIRTDKIVSMIFVTVLIVLRFYEINELRLIFVIVCIP